MLKVVSDHSVCYGDDEKGECQSKTISENEIETTKVEASTNESWFL